MTWLMRRYIDENETLNSILICSDNELAVNQLHN
jgi:hypothetical protein